MAWIESHQALATHPKTRRLARRLGISRPQAIGHLHLLWWWAVDYAADGDLERYDAEDLADAAEWDGDPEEFVAALVAAGFVDVAENGARTIHDWHEHAGMTIELRERQRAQAAERQRRHRARNGHVTRDNRDESVTSRSPARPRPDLTRPYLTEPDQDLTEPAAAAGAHEELESAWESAMGRAPTSNEGAWLVGRLADGEDLETLRWALGELSPDVAKPTKYLERVLDAARRRRDGPDPGDQMELPLVASVAVAAPSAEDEAAWEQARTYLDGHLSPGNRDTVARMTFAGRDESGAPVLAAPNAVMGDRARRLEYLMLRALNEVPVFALDEAAS